MSSPELGGIEVVTPVLFTPRAFEKAQGHGIVDVTPNPHEITALAEELKTPEFKPDITIIRDFSFIKHDQVFDPNDPADNLLPASALRGRLETVPAELLSRYLEAGKVVTQLMVRRWEANDLGLTDELIDAMTLASDSEKSHLFDVASKIVKSINFITKPGMDTSKFTAARGIDPTQHQPYTVKHLNA